MSSSRALVSRSRISRSPTHTGSWYDEFSERTEASPDWTSRRRICSVLECVSNEYVEDCGPVKASIYFQFWRREDPPPTVRRRNTVIAGPRRTYGVQDRGARGVGQARPPPRGGDEGLGRELGRLDGHYKLGASVLLGDSRRVGGSRRLPFTQFFLSWHVEGKKTIRVFIRRRPT